MEAVFSLLYAIQPGAVTPAPPNPGSRQYAVGIFTTGVQNIKIQVS